MVELDHCLDLLKAPGKKHEHIHQKIRKGIYYGFTIGKYQQFTWTAKSGLDRKLERSIKHITLRSVILSGWQKRKKSRDGSKSVSNALGWGGMQVPSASSVGLWHPLWER